MFLIPPEWYSIKTTKKKGRAAFARKDIEPGTVIGDYVGTIVRDSYAHDETRFGLYDMEGGKNYDILANPSSDGVERVNNACSPNCALYPYKGHILFFALRHIYAGEELTVYYHIGVANENDISCAKHVCHCGSKICTGTFHESAPSLRSWYRAWLKLVRKNFGSYYTKPPAQYGEELPPLKKYPGSISANNAIVYPDIFGTEIKSPMIYQDISLPSLPEITKRIRETGRQLSFPKLHLTIYGIRDGMLLVNLRRRL